MNPRVKKPAKFKGHLVLPRGKSVTKIILSSSSNEGAVTTMNESDSGYSMNSTDHPHAARDGQPPLHGMGGGGLEDDLSLLDLSSMPAGMPAMMADSEAGPDIADDEFRPANTDIFKERTTKSFP